MVHQLFLHQNPSKTKDVFGISGYSRIFLPFSLIYKVKWVFFLFLSSSYLAWKSIEIFKLSYTILANLVSCYLYRNFLRKTKMATSQVQASAFECVLRNQNHFHKNLKVLVNSCVSDQWRNGSDSNENAHQIDITDLWAHNS